MEEFRSDKMLQTNPKMSESPVKGFDSHSFNCVSIDLETDNDGKIFAIGAVRHDSERVFKFKEGKLDAVSMSINKALKELDEFAKGADFIIGHNFIEFDLPILSAAGPDLQLIHLPIVDTLRLSPLAFPRNPYHHLIKHYQDGSIRRGRLNDPELDARLTLEVFDDQLKALPNMSTDLLAAWHWLCTADFKGIDSALNEIFSKIRNDVRPERVLLVKSVKNCLTDASCMEYGNKAIDMVEKIRWEMAYALAWMSVAGGNSVMPPWVRHQFPKTRDLVKKLRDTPCSNPKCEWCSVHHSAVNELKRWFEFDSYRSDPKDEFGKSLQQSIVEASMKREHALGILPTGTGKSICYQVPALSRYEKTGALTVIISPLVALMADQVAGLEGKNISSCITINGLLSMPERSDAIDRVRLGDVGMLLISPEQLRSKGIRDVISQREIGGWVLDEAHCLSRWGHDFRPDYRYIGRFIKESAGSSRIPPILCLTATAKQDVIKDITNHFKDRLEVDLKVFSSEPKRTNLTFGVIPTTNNEKYSDICQILDSKLPPTLEGGAIVYCATRKQCEYVSEFLQLKDMKADFFHAGLSPERKKDVQKRFIEGELRVIAATNAFGMGIDKPDVRLVVHADIPGSLENYLQEAGRAGRDRKPAECILIYTNEDVERQFSMSAYSRLTRVEIHGILRALRKLNFRVRKKNPEQDIVATSGEILKEDEENEFNRDSNTDDTRVRTAISWLEETEFLTREENRVQIFPSSLLVNSVEEAQKKLKSKNMNEKHHQHLLRIAESLIESNKDEGITTDDLMGKTGLNFAGIRNAIYDLRECGVVKDDIILTAFVHSGVDRSSEKRFNEGDNLEVSLIEHMRELHPDMKLGESSTLFLRTASQTLRDKGLVDPLPEKIWRIVTGISYDGRGEDNAVGSISVKRRGMETVQVTLKRSWEKLEETARIRRNASRMLLNHLLSKLPKESRGTDILVETTLGSIKEALESDSTAQIKNIDKLLDRSLMWLHEQEVIRLNRGMTVFRPAMRIKLDKQEKRGFTKADFQPLEMHYKGKVLQIHVMKEFAERGLKAIGEALNLAMDYFSLHEQEFLDRWLPGKDKEIGRETTVETWKQIVEDLRNANQQNIVADQREQTNVLVLAGPGSGKTTVLVHRIAFLIRAKRERADSILALAYNRHAAVEIRRRLTELIGDDARRVIVLTCHGLAMRLVGRSFASQVDQQDNDVFDEVLQNAINILNGKDLPPEDADHNREQLLSRFRWILVDEYQDIGKSQYDLIAAVAGRSLESDSSKLTIFAVGDDDQNIYSFNGASVEFIRRFEEDYGPKPLYLVSNYRSTGHIIAASNRMIEPARERMKSDQPIRINKKRAKNSQGGEWERIDPVSRGRVQILEIKGDTIAQTQAVMMELERLSKLDSKWNWSKCAVIAREWKYLVPVRTYCELNNIPMQMADENIPTFWRLRETREFVQKLKSLKKQLVNSSDLNSIMKSRTSNPWNELLWQAIDESKLENGENDVPLNYFLEWLAEWGREFRRRQKGLLLLSGHRAKGLEFNHVAILDGGWNRVGKGEDPDAPRRLYYVAMTRARQTLTLAQFNESNNQLLGNLRKSASVVRRIPPKIQSSPDELKQHWISAELKDVDLGFAGRRPTNDGIHKAIQSLSYGDELKMEPYKERWLLKNKSGAIVGRLSKNFQPPMGMTCKSVKVMAIVGREKDMTEPEYRELLKCESWEVVVPEFIYMPKQ